MTKEELSEIIKLKKEVKQLQGKLRELGYDGDNETIVSDKVKGSMSEFPFSSRSFNLIGFEQMTEECIQKRTEIGQKISQKYYELNCKINKAIDYIHCIDDSEIRQILTYKYIDGLTWEEISEVMSYNESTLRKKIRAWERNVE